MELRSAAATTAVAAMHNVSFGASGNQSASPSSSSPFSSSFPSSSSPSSSSSSPFYDDYNNNANNSSNSAVSWQEFQDLQHLLHGSQNGDPAGLLSDRLVRFQMWFQGIHGYASILVCLFGVTTNVFNVTILMRRDMRTPTNLLLMWLAVSDILTMLPYVPFVGNFYCPPTSPFSNPERFSYGWMVYMLVMINFVATTHTISIWIGVSLAAVRFVQMRSTSRGHAANERRIKQAKMVTFLVIILSCLVLVPNYLTNKLELVKMDNRTFYMIQDLKLATNETRNIVVINVVTYAVVAKLIPCILILIFSGSLVYTLTIQGRGRRRRLATSSCSKASARARQSTTTRMLLVVIILFLLTELPQGVLILISAARPGFYQRVYLPLGDLMDFIALLNNAINFVLYCIMSQQFRARFAHMYLRRRVRLKAVSCETTTTGAPPPSLAIGVGPCSSASPSPSSDVEKLMLREPPTRTSGLE